MKDRTVIFCIFSACFYIYSVYVLFTNTDILKMRSKTKVEKQSDVTPNMSQLKDETDAKKIPLSPKNACSVSEVFVQKPKKKNKKRRRYEEDDTTTLTFIAVSILLLLLLLNALFDVLCEKELEKCKKMSKSKGERRQSLAEFANKKMRRESSKFGQQLSQIEESVVTEGDKTSREARPYMRGDSMNSYLSEKSKKTENYTSASIGEIDTKPVNRQSVAKPSGARPAPMVRRSSYPALPQNPEIQCLALGSKQGSFDSDDEDAKGRRVRILRRS